MSRASQILHRLIHGDGRSLFYTLWLRSKRIDYCSAECEAPLLTSTRSHGHAQSGGPYLDAVIKGLRIPESRAKTALDLGSGKGLAAITLSKYFKSVEGVELSPELVAVARRNVSKLKIDNIHFTIGDAGVYRFSFPPPSLIYLFNPFPCGVCEEVFSNLTAQIRNKDALPTIVYKNPVCHATLLKNGYQLTRCFSFRFSHPFHVYESSS